MQSTILWAAWSNRRPEQRNVCNGLGSVCVIGELLYAVLTRGYCLGASVLAFVMLQLSCS